MMPVAASKMMMARKTVVGEEFVTGKHRPENDRPQNDGAQEPASEDASLGQGRRASPRFVIRHIRSRLAIKPALSRRLKSAAKMKLRICFKKAPRRLPPVKCSTNLSWRAWTRSVHVAGNLFTFRQQNHKPAKLTMPTMVFLQGGIKLGLAEIRARVWA